MSLVNTELVEIKTAILPSVVEFNVTDEDILLAVKGSRKRCPIARAITRSLALGGHAIERASVVYNFVTVYSDNRRHYYDHQYEEFIKDFDCGREVLPFSGVATVECKENG